MFETWWESVKSASNGLNSERKNSAEALILSKGTAILDAPSRSWVWPKLKATQIHQVTPHSFEGDFGESPRNSEATELHPSPPVAPRIVLCP